MFDEAEPAPAPQPSWWQRLLRRKPAPTGLDLPRPGIRPRRAHDMLRQALDTAVRDGAAQLQGRPVAHIHISSRLPEIDVTLRDMMPPRVSDAAQSVADMLRPLGVACRPGVQLDYCFEPHPDPDATRTVLDADVRVRLSAHPGSEHAEPAPGGATAMPFFPQQGTAMPDLAQRCARRDHLRRRARCTPPGRGRRRLHAVEAGARLHRPGPPRRAGRRPALCRPGPAAAARGLRRRGPLAGARERLDTRLAAQPGPPVRAERRRPPQPLGRAHDGTAQPRHRGRMAAAAGAEHDRPGARPARLPERLRAARRRRAGPARPLPRPGRRSPHAGAGRAQQRALPLHQPGRGRRLQGGTPGRGRGRRRPCVGPPGRRRLRGSQRDADADRPAARPGGQRPAA
ncbi:hypothetical protein OSTOST_05041 [Ostertagia ostertagi]